MLEGSSMFYGVMCVNFMKQDLFLFPQDSTHLLSDISMTYKSAFATSCIEEILKIPKFPRKQ